MKNSLGKVIVILLCTLWLGANDFTHTFHIDKQNPYVKEGVILTLDLNQTNKNKVLFFQFTLKQSLDYEFYRLTAKESGENTAAKIHYEYLIYPLYAGEIALDFDLIQKATTEENLAYSFSGDRDNVKGLTTVNSKINLPTLILKIQALPQGTSLVGDFSLTRSIKKHKAKAYEPLPFQVTIKGSGYPPLLENLVPVDSNFTLFKENPIIHTVNTSQGTKSTVVYPMALSHSQSFDLSPIVLKAFDPKSQKSYVLSLAKQHFDISSVDTGTLLDKVDTPKPLKSDTSWFTTLFVTLLSYLVVFAAGFLTAISVKWKKKRSKKTLHPLKEKIKACKEEKALLRLLIATDVRHYASSIEKLEESLYGNGKINFNKVKQEVLEMIK